MKTKKNQYSFIKSGGVMYRKLFSALIIALIVFSASAADYCFPSASPPAGKSPGEVPMYVCLIFDDIAYSGLKKSPYEWEEGCVWADLGRVGGEAPNSWENPHNPLNLEEGDIGASWVTQTLAQKGGGFHVTFNVMTGAQLRTLLHRPAGRVIASELLTGLIQQLNAGLRCVGDVNMM